MLRNLPLYLLAVLCLVAVLVNALALGDALRAGGL